MQNLPIGIHTFERIRNENRLYIDKTAYIHKFITTSSVYFLSRPRRFGKSLLISTLTAIFEGKKELFEGLWIRNNTDYDFEEFPVFRIDLSQKKVDTPADLKEYLIYATDRIAQKYDIQLTPKSYDLRFLELLRKMSAVNQVVVLIVSSQ